MRPRRICLRAQVQQAPTRCLPGAQRSGILYRTGENHKYYVTYSDGQNPEGEMFPQDIVRIRNDMVFDVSTTYQS